MSNQVFILFDFMNKYVHRTKILDYYYLKDLLVTLPKVYATDVLMKYQMPIIVHSIGKQCFHFKEVKILNELEGQTYLYII